jgi:hypothetical protein
MLADATQRLQSEVPPGRPWRFEAVMMAVLLAHAKRLEQVRVRWEAIGAETHRPEGNPPT